MSPETIVGLKVVLLILSIGQYLMVAMVFFAGEFRKKWHFAMWLIPLIFIPLGLYKGIVIGIDRFQDMK